MDCKIEIMLLIDIIPILTANIEDFGINTNILETNLVNQLILAIGLFILGRDFLTKSLGERQTEIVSNVQNSEKTLADAELRLKEAQKQLSQAKLIMTEIQDETKKTQLSLLQSDYEYTQAEIQRKYKSALLSIKNRERLILSEIKQQISLLAIEQVMRTLESQSGSEREQIQYTTTQIQMLKSSADSIH